MGRAALPIGTRHGKLVVLVRDPHRGTIKHPRYIVRCDCGVEYSMLSHVFAVATGCKKCNPGGSKRKYGDRVIQGTPLYMAWAGMKHRCYADRPDNKAWFGRGIKVCDEWVENYPAFEAWGLANGYRKGLSINRIDVDGDYSPDNCEWITRSDNSKQARASYLTIRRPKSGQFPESTPIEMCWG